MAQNTRDRQGNQVEYSDKPGRVQYGTDQHCDPCLELSDAIPEEDFGDGSSGTGTEASRDDHVHPLFPAWGWMSTDGIVQGDLPLPLQNTWYFWADAQASRTGSNGFVGFVADPVNGDNLRPIPFVPGHPGENGGDYAVRGSVDLDLGEDTDDLELAIHVDNGVSKDPLIWSLYTGPGLSGVSFDGILALAPGDIVTLGVRNVDSAGTTVSLRSVDITIDRIELAPQAP